MRIHPDPDADSSYQNNADLSGSGSTTRLLLENFYHLKIYADPVPDPTYHFDIVPDTDPNFYFIRMQIRMRIQVPKKCWSIRIRMLIHSVPDADPQHDFFSGCGSGSITRLLLENFLSFENWCGSGPGSSLSLSYSSGYRSGFLFYANANPDADPSSKTMRIHPDSDADSSYQNNADPSGSTTRLLLENFYHLKIDADPVPDPVYHFDIFPDTDPNFYFMLIQIRMRIQFPKQCGSIQIRMRIHQDPDADPSGSGCWSTTRLFLENF